MQYIPFLSKRGERMSMSLVISKNKWRAEEDLEPEEDTKGTACTSAFFPIMSFRHSKQVLCGCSGLGGRERKRGTIKSQNRKEKNLTKSTGRASVGRKLQVGESLSRVKICFIVWCASLDCIISEPFMWEVPKSRVQHLNEKVN